MCDVVWGHKNVSGRLHQRVSTFSTGQNTFRKLNPIPKFFMGQRIHPHITLITESPRWQYLCGHFGWGWNLFPPKWEFKALCWSQTKFYPANIWCSYFDSCKTNSGVNREPGALYAEFISQNPQFLTPGAVISGSNQVSAISEDNLGNVFLGTLSGGMSDSTIKHVNLNCFISGSSVPLSIYSLLITKTGQSSDRNRKVRDWKNHNYSSNTVEDYQMNFSFWFFKG